MGFAESVSLHRAIRLRVMALAPTGLIPVEHVCLYWTHKGTGPL